MQWSNTHSQDTYQTIYFLYCSIPSMFIWRTTSILHYYCICPTTFLWTKHFWSRWQRCWDTTRFCRGIRRLLLLIWWFVVIQGYTRSLLPLLAVLDALAIVLDLVAYTLSPYWLVLIHDHVVINKLTEDRSELENKARYKSAHLGYNCIERLWIDQTQAKWKKQLVVAQHTRYTDITHLCSFI